MFLKIPSQTAAKGSSYYENFWSLLVFVKQSTNQATKRIEFVAIGKEHHGLGFQLIIHNIFNFYERVFSAKIHLTIVLW